MEATDSALSHLGEVLRSATFDLGEHDVEAIRDRLVADVEGHRARLRDLDAPLLVVVGGVTGAGKSTLVNTLAGRRVAATGVVRPTTTTPTLVGAPDDVGWFETPRVLPDLARSTGDAASPGTLRLTASAALPRGLALLDAPDVDSVAAANRDLADALLDAADVWLWCTTAGKYADEDSMAYLRRARERHTALAVVLTQVRPADEAEVVADFRAKLAAEDLAQVPLLVVPYAGVVDGQLDADAVAALTGWLARLADPGARRAFRQATLEGAVAALPRAVQPVIDSLEAQLRTARTLLAAADRGYDDARRDFALAVEQGLPLQREVLTRWNRFVGTGRFLALTEAATGQARAWVRSLLANAASGEEQRLEREVRVEVTDTLERTIADLADLAAAGIVDAWEREPAGRVLAARHPELQRAGPQLDQRAVEAIAAWQDTVVELVQTKGADRKVRARWLSTVVNAAATGALVVSLAHTGGLTGAEAGIATAAGAANQALLTRLLGAHNLRWLISAARADLTERVGDVMAAERRRFAAAVADAAPDPALPDALRAALA